MSKSLYERLLPAPRNGGFAMEGYWVWCGSVVQGEDGRFHMFASRWPKELPMHPGWLVRSEVVRAVSDTPEGPYRFQEVVLPARGAEYWDGRSTHNPHIVKHDGHYLLYYMGTTHPFPDVAPGEPYGLSDPRCIVARSNKRIGLAISRHVEGPWERLDSPILDVRPGKYDSYLTSNPAPCVHEDGSVLLIYKARAYEGHEYSDMSLGAARADHYRGPYYAVSDEPIFPPSDIHLEDPFVWRTESGYEMIAKDMNGNVAGEKHGGIHARSVDGLKWQVSDNPKSYSRIVAWNDGTTQYMGNFERPFLLFREGQPTHLFAATADGTGGFSGRNTWNMVIPIRNNKEA
ncbi:glycoside hydrolase family protein [Paenibacillus sp. GCM10023248]|uniref:glycoside hydrolase family protein n=1 Tax=unclassified Paenibacillus TaxID=185978 RepID=UPI002377E041|nr:glycoside hydrolase family protein [Paenibacillus sp. MAHUQ-63]MDD9267297.1 glycoside hydrolase family protein [Paenibacillus sp. MAHUQ-63]